MLAWLGGGSAWPHWSFLAALFSVALTLLAAGAALAMAFRAAFFLLVVFGSVSLLYFALFSPLARRHEDSGTKRVRAANESPAQSQSAVCADISPSFIVLPAHARADEMTRVLFARQSYFPVAQGREVVGVVSKGQLLRAMAQGHGDRLIAELMNPARSARPVFTS